MWVHKLQILNLIIVSLFTSCVNYNNDQQLYDALALAGSNRSQLEDVLNYFEDDSLGLEAAKYLIRNMPGHYSYADTIAMDAFYCRLDSLVAELKGKDSKVIQDSINNFCEVNRINAFPIIQDVKIIKSDFLIDNIEVALSQWKRLPWCDRLDFEQFCEYVLPYKSSELQELKPWRRNYEYLYKDSLERMLSCSLFRISSFQAAEIVNNALKLKFSYDPESYDIPPLFYRSFSRLAIPFGTCEDLCNAGLNIFRAAGVPCAIDYTPLWGYGNRGHTWGVVRAPNGKDQPFVPVHMSPYVVHKINETVSKVYRRTFARNPELVKLNDDCNFVPDPFRNIFQKDVTSMYADVRDLFLNVKNATQKYVYLCTTSGDKWKPVAYSKISSGYAEFKNIGKGCIYLLCEYNKEGEMIVLDSPFKIERNGGYSPINPDLAKKRHVRLFRKGPLLEYAWRMAILMENGLFEASDDPDFTKPIDVGRVMSSADQAGEISVQHNIGAHRYWRYVKKADTAICSVGELRFISDDVDITDKGIVIGNFNKKSVNPFYNGSRAFDGDVLTPVTFSNHEEAWVGLDFVDKIRIDKIRFTPRSDGDMIEPGDVYELMYWNNNRWNSLGRDVASNVYLDYYNIPSNAIYILHDRTKGSSERIFLINSDGQQEWW